MVAVKSEDKVLRENNEKVYLPVGTEYSVLLKNLNSKKASVRVFIDGQDVLNGNSLIIDAHSEMELERFLGDNMDSGRRFRFVEKSKKISDYRGDKPEDGILRIEVQFEKEFDYNPWYPPYYKNTWLPNDIKYSWNCNSDKSVAYDSLEKDIQPQGFCGHNQNSVLRSMNVSNQTPQTECSGITVKGSESQQQFKYGNIGVLEDKKHVICLQLKGVKPSGKQVNQPITVKDKVQCEICGTKNKSNHKYCVECGNYLY